MRRVRARTDEDGVDADVADRGAGGRPMYSRARCGCFALGGLVEIARGSGTCPSIGATCAGFVPQLTCG